MTAYVGRSLFLFVLITAPVCLPGATMLVSQDAQTKPAPSTKPAPPTEARPPSNLQAVPDGSGTPAEAAPAPPTNFTGWPDGSGTPAETAPANPSALVKAVDLWQK